MHRRLAGVTRLCSTLSKQPMETNSPGFPFFLYSQCIAGLFCKSNCLVQSRTYAPTGNRDLERDFLSHSLFSRLIAPTLRSGISIAVTIRSFDPSLSTRLIAIHSFDTNRSLDRTYRRGRTVSCDSLVIIKHLANEPINSVNQVIPMRGKMARLPTLARREIAVIGFSIINSWTQNTRSCSIEMV